MLESISSSGVDIKLPSDSILNKENKKSRLKSILIFSIPDHANVFVNDSLFGQTPLEYTYPQDHFGSVFIDLKKEGYKNWEYNYMNPPEENIKIVAVLDSVYGIIRVNSEPSNADVFINDSLMGTTPLNSIRLKHGEYNIKITKDKYEDFKSSFDLQSRLISFSAELVSKYTTITNSNIHKSSKVFIDSKEVSMDSLDNYEISTGSHEFEIIDSHNKKYLSKTLSIKPEYNYNLGVRYNKFTLVPFGLSAVVPGLGQLYNGSTVKGASLLLGSMLAGLFSGITIKSYNDKLDKYNEAQIFYLKSINENEAITRRSYVNSTHSDAKKALNYKRLAVGSLIAVYAINLIDAILYESSTDFIEVSANLKPSFTDFGPFPDNYNFKVKLNMQLDF